MASTASSARRRHPVTSARVQFPTTQALGYQRDTGHLPPRQPLARHRDDYGQLHPVSAQPIHANAGRLPDRAAFLAAWCAVAGEALAALAVVGSVPPAMVMVAAAAAVQAPAAAVECPQLMAHLPPDLARRIRLAADGLAEEGDPPLGWATVAEAAAFLGVTDRAVRSSCDSGTLTHQWLPSAQGRGQLRIARWSLLLRATRVRLASAHKLAAQHQLMRDRAAAILAAGEKRCPSCERIRPLGAFNRMTKALDGRQTVCRSCQRDYQPRRRPPEWPPEWPPGYGP